MQATTKTFSVEFPAVYEHIQPVWESILAEHRQNNKCLSYINIALLELNMFKEYEGDDLPARFREFCKEERGTVEVIADRSLQVAGIGSTVRTVQAPNGYFYYFALIPISSEYGYLFIGDCEIGSAAYYEPLFDAIWQSLQYFGNPAAAAKERDAAIDKLMAGYSTPEEEAPKTFEPFIVPANGEEYWQIGDHAFTFTAERPCEISDGDGALYITIHAQAPAHLSDKENDVINDYEHGKVYLQFYFKGIYNAGIPTGKFHFDKERDTTRFSYVWNGGFHYMQELTAEVTLQDGWLGINGYFKEYPVKLAIQLPVEKLDWEKYRFLSAEEVSTAPPAIVRQLWLTDAYAGILQETLEPLTQLQTLAIDYRDSKLAADLKEVPRAVKRMSELKDILLTGVAALDSLPQWLGDLKKLESIRVSGSKIEGIHPYIFQLPLLTKLYLGGNQLQSIHPALPENLETLILSGNKLTTVPASVTGVQYLDIENNPLQQLPAGLENIPNLTLELEKKIALLDYTYKGADGKGTIPYNDTHFFAKHDPELLSLLEGQIIVNELNEFKEGFINRTRWSVALETTEADAYTEKGNHRFGGLPDLPTGMPYPVFTTWENEEKGLQFLAQINCTAIAHLQQYLPRTGVLYFFITDQEDLKPTVIYYDGDSNSLQSAKELNIDNDFIYDQHGLYEPFRAEAGKYASIPSLYNASSLYPELAELEERYEETDKLKAGLVAGAAQPVHGINSYVFKQHDTPEIEAVDKLKGKPEDWMVLLRVSSDNNPGFCFWDAGEIYFVIHKSDLDKKDFSNVHCGLESS